MEFLRMKTQAKLRETAIVRNLFSVVLYLNVIGHKQKYVDNASTT